jgi:hypothetical protein
MGIYGKLPAIVAVISVAVIGSAAFAQSSTGPVNPNPNPPVNPLTEDASKTIVINPTTDECSKGWNPGLKWSKEQFAEYCAQMTVSK